GFLDTGTTVTSGDRGGELGAGGVASAPPSHAVGAACPCGTLLSRLPAVPKEVALPWKGLRFAPGPPVAPSAGSSGTGTLGGRRARPWSCPAASNTARGPTRRPTACGSSRPRRATPATCGTSGRSPNSTALDALGRIEERRHAEAESCHPLRRDRCHP